MIPRSSWRTCLTNTRMAMIAIAYHRRDSRRRELMCRRSSRGLRCCLSLPGTSIALWTLMRRWAGLWRLAHIALASRTLEDKVFGSSRGAVASAPARLLRCRAFALMTGLGPCLLRRSSRRPTTACRFLFLNLCSRSSCGAPGTSRGRPTPGSRSSLGASAYVMASRGAGRLLGVAL